MSPWNRILDPPTVEPFHDEAEIDEDRFELSVDEVVPGEQLEAHWPDEERRGPAYVLELQVGDEGDVRYCLVTGTCRICATERAVCDPLEVVADA